MFCFLHFCWSSRWLISGLSGYGTSPATAQVGNEKHQYLDTNCSNVCIIAERQITAKGNGYRSVFASRHRVPYSPPIETSPARYLWVPSGCPTSHIVRMDQSHTFTETPVAHRTNKTMIPSTNPTLLSFVASLQSTEALSHRPMGVLRYST
jgi:hypothetical protein